MMSIHRACLRLKFEDDGDGTGKLCATVEARGFAGRGGAWFGINQVEKFAEAIGVYPLPADKRHVLSGGYWKSHRLDQEHFAIEISQIDRRGHIGVQVRIASELTESSRPQSQSMLRVEMYTTYERLRQFSDDLRALVHDAGGKEILLEEGSD